MNLLTKQKEIHRLREWTCGSQVEGIVREFRMDTYTLLYFKWITNCIAHGTLLSVTWQPGWEGSLWENGYMYRHGSVPSLFTLNYHSIVNWLSPIQNKNLKKKKKISRPTPDILSQQFQVRGLRIWNFSKFHAANAVNCYFILFYY